MAPDLTFSEHEREFLTAFCTILQHLHNRCIKAEREAKSLRDELNHHRERLEYEAIMKTDATPDSGAYIKDGNAT